MKPGNLSEETIKRLPAPAKGNPVTYFAGAMIQGPKPLAVSVFASPQLALALSSSTTGYADANIASQLALAGLVGTQGRTRSTQSSPTR